MTGRFDPAAPTEALDEAEVAAYLRRHPDFLDRHGDLVEVLVPPSRWRDQGVVDMQTFLIERLRRETERLRADRAAVIAVGRRNLSRQAEVHAAVIAMLGARTLARLVEVVTEDFLGVFDADVVSLCVESAERDRPGLRSGILCLPPGTVDDVLGDAEEIRLVTDGPGDVRVFDGGAGLVRSAAIIRLRLGERSPACLLALGARRPGTFASDRGSELLRFLGRALEHCLRAWLDLPA